MNDKRIIYPILVIFILGIFVLIYIQYNSTKNIYNLIDGNEKFIRESNINKKLRELKRDVVFEENRLFRSNVNGTRSRGHVDSLQAKIASINANLSQLQKISDDDSTEQLIDVLDTLVQTKIAMIKRTADSPAVALQANAGGLGMNTVARPLNDSILSTINRISDTRQRLLTAVTVANDENGRSALRLAIILSALALLSVAGLFWYIINTLRKQSQLIHDLNISEKKVRESVQIKEKFIANISHEIRTPMNAILGFTSLLRKKELDDQSAEFVQLIEKSGENLLAIINDVLDLSKIEAGMMRIESAPFSIRGLLHSTESMFRGRANENDISLMSSVDKSVPDLLDGDAVRLTQILSNLIGNSLKFTKKGSVQIKISNEGLEGNLIMIGIRVEDTGIGIENDKLKNIFDRFHQVEDAVTRHYGGTGLGLAIVRELVLLQQGSISVESVVEKGTTFQVFIPYKIVREKIKAKLSPEFQPQLTEKLNHIKVLVVDDHEINQSLIRHLFGRWNLSFDAVYNGREAIDKLRENEYELILMDIQMPEMDGYTTVSIIREELKLRTPIIAMTAHALAGEKEKCLRFGMNEYVSKPIRESQLFDLILRFIQIDESVERHNDPDRAAFFNEFHFIRLDYMKEISRGNLDYEKAVTEQFIDSVPKNLAAMEKAWKNDDIAAIHHIAHDMKTTVSVMGLTELMQPYLDILECEALTPEIFERNFTRIRVICKSALEEAGYFFSTLPCMS